jgi:hypothetical protein
MDTLHNVLRSLRPETKGAARGRRDHLVVFREFLDHLDRAARKRAASHSVKATKGKGRRGKR